MTSEERPCIKNTDISSGTMQRHSSESYFLVHHQVIQGSPSSFKTAIRYSSLHIPSFTCKKQFSCYRNKAMLLTYIHSYQLLGWAAWFRSPTHCDAVPRMLSDILHNLSASLPPPELKPGSSSLSWADAEELTIRKVTRSSCPNQQHSQWLLQLNCH